MTELERLEIIRRVQGGASYRAIARALRIDRKTVASVMHAYQQLRERPSSALSRGRVRRSQLDGYDDVIAALLDRYPAYSGQAERPFRRS
jgi:transposase